MTGWNRVESWIGGAGAAFRVAGRQYALEVNQKIKGLVRAERSHIPNSFALNFMEGPSAHESFTEKTRQGAVNDTHRQRLVVVPQLEVR